MKLLQGKLFHPLRFVIFTIIVYLSVELFFERVGLLLIVIRLEVGEHAFFLHLSGVLDKLFVVWLFDVLLHDHGIEVVHLRGKLVFKKIIGIFLGRLFQVPDFGGVVLSEGAGVVYDCIFSFDIQIILVSDWRVLIVFIGRVVLFVISDLLVSISLYSINRIKD